MSAITPHKHLTYTYVISSVPYVAPVSIDATLMSLRDAKRSLKRLTPDQLRKLDDWLHKLIEQADKDSRGRLLGKHNEREKRRAGARRTGSSACWPVSRLPSTARPTQANQRRRPDVMKQMTLLCREAYFCVWA